MSGSKQKIMLTLNLVVVPLVLGFWGTYALVKYF